MFYKALGEVVSLPRVYLQYVKHAYYQLVSATAQPLVDQDVPQAAACLAFAAK